MTTLRTQLFFLPRNLDHVDYDIYTRCVRQLRHTEIQIVELFIHYKIPCYPLHIKNRLIAKSSQRELKLAATQLL